MKELIKIENENLSNYIMFKLDKIDNEFTREDINKITEVVIDYNNETTSSFLFLRELLKLKKLKTITLRNGYIYNDNYTIFLKLENLCEFIFDNCEFENANLMVLLNPKSLSLINCKIKDYSFISKIDDLEELTIINGEIEVKKINQLANLKYLQISYSTIIDEVELNNKLLKELYIDNTNIISFTFLEKLVNLKKISIDENQYKISKDIFDNLMKKNIIILNENMVEFGGESNEI